MLASHVGDEENDAEHDAESAHNNVADCQKVVRAAQNVSGREHEVLIAGKRAHIVEVHDFQIVCSLLEFGFDFAIKFAEVRKACGTHPHNEVL